MTDQPTRAEGAADPGAPPPRITVRELADSGHTSGGVVEVRFESPWIKGKGYVDGHDALDRARAYAAALAAALAADPHRQGIKP